MYINGKLRKKLGGPSRGTNKNLGGHGAPKPPLRIATGYTAQLHLTVRARSQPSFS